MRQAGRFDQDAECYVCGMTRIRVSTTVDSQALAAARNLGLGTDSVTLDAALIALLASHRAADIDQAYTAYDDHPLDEPDEWGNLAAFRESVGRTRKRPNKKAS